MNVVSGGADELGVGVAAPPGRIWLQDVPGLDDAVVNGSDVPGVLEGSDTEKTGPEPGFGGVDNGVTLVSGKLGEFGRGTPELLDGLSPVDPARPDED